MPCLVVLLIALGIIAAPFVGALLLGIFGMMSVGVLYLIANPELIIFMVMIVVAVLGYFVWHTVKEEAQKDKDRLEREREYQEQKRRDSGNT